MVVNLQNECKSKEWMKYPNKGCKNRKNFRPWKVMKKNGGLNIYNGFLGFEKVGNKHLKGL